MGKFLNTMCQQDSNALKNRAKQLDTQFRIAQKSIISSLEDKIAKTEIKIQDLTDFAPETTDSLRPGGKLIAPSDWAKQMQENQVLLFDLKRNLKIAQNTFKEYFGEDETAEVEAEPETKDDENED